MICTVNVILNQYLPAVFRRHRNMLLNVDASMPPLRDLGGFRGLQEEEGIGDSRGAGETRRLL